MSKAKMRGNRSCCAERGDAIGRGRFGPLCTLDKLLLVGLIALVCGVGLATPAQAAKDDTVLVSRADAPSGAGANDISVLSGSSTVSADGRFVVFQSNADNLSTEDNDAVTNVYVRDVETGRTIFVSRASGAAGAPGDSLSFQPTISANGRHVAFASVANNFSDEDNDAPFNIYVRNLDTNTTTFVSRATGPTGTAADASSTNPSISGDGRYVAFQSAADNLSDADNNVVTNVFVRDLQTGTTSLVSRASGATGAGGENTSTSASISADGRYVAFGSSADNLSAEDNDAVGNIYVRDLQANTTIFVSRATGAAGTAGDASSSNPSISADGRFVAFESTADNLSVEDNDTVANIYVRDLQANTTTFVSRATGAAGAAADAGSSNPSISGDGRFVAFESGADNLSADDNDAVTNIYVRSLQSGTTIFVSRVSGPSGAAADASSANPSVSGDGRFVVFQSDANNLSAEDDDLFSNVFRRDVLGGFALSVARAGSGQGTVTSSPAGIDCGADCSQEFTTGSSVTLTASPAAGSRFVGFSGGGCSGTGPCTVTADQTRNVTATFSLVGAGTTPPPRPPTYPTPPPFVSAAFPGCPALTANVIRGTAAANTITGTVRADRIFAGTGDDVVDALAGNDCVDLGTGADRGQGGLGNDLMLGGLGRDRISSSSGNDRIGGGPDDDRINGGSGNDRVRGDSGNDTLLGSFGNDILHGVSGGDRISGSRGRDRVNGGSGRDRISGGSSGDRIAGDQAGDRINGNSGNDRIRGNSGNDRITGSTGADRLAGDSGNDRINSRDGRRDRINCGRGRDTVIADRRDRVARNCERVRRR